MLLKQNSPITSQKLGSRDFWQIAKSVLNKGKSAIPPLFNGPEVLPSASELAQLVPLPYPRGRSTRYSDRLHDFSVTIPRCYKDVYVNSFFPRTARLWNSLPIECFPLTYDLSGFKSRINRHLLTVGSF